MHQRLGVTGPQRLVVRWVGHRNTMTAGEVARTLHVHPSSLTGTLRRLQSAKLLRREADPRDRRRAVLSLTARGKRLNGQRTGSIEAVVEGALRRVPNGDLRAAERVLQAVVTALEKDRTR
ncbi:MAG: MarR family transcriptional regulator [Myxococcota bacterium]|nr:MarR family transcriptional regulator [Myxococcota bacterium]